MAAGNFILYSNALEGLLDGTIDLDTDDFRLVLVTSSYTPAQNTDAAWSTISTNEVANGSGYTTHGKALTVTLSRTDNVVTLDCDDQTWSSSSITAKYAVIVRDADGNGALAAGDLPVAFVNLDTGGGSVSSTSADFVVTINANGVATFTAATS
jgi:hypothetical protein